MEHIGVSDARRRFYQLLDEVEHTGRPIVIQRRGKDIATLVPARAVGEISDAERAEWVISELRAVRESQRKGGPRLRGQDLVEEGRER